MSSPHGTLQRRFIFIVLLVAALLAPGSRGQARAASDGAGDDVLSICHGGAPGIPVVLAKEKGLFAAEGVGVTLKKYRTATEGLEGFFRGECELAAISETSVVMKSFDRQDFSILATFSTSDNSPRILANRESGIATPGDLKGKRIFVLKGSSNHFFLDMFLAKHGMSARDVNVITANVPDVSAALTDGSIDAFCATEVLIDKPLRALGGQAVVFESPGLCLVSFHLVAKNSLISASPDKVKKIVAALLKNEQAIQKDRGAAIKTAAVALGVEEPVMRDIWDNYRWNVELTQSMLLSLEQEAQWAMDGGLTTKTRIPNYLNFIHRDPLRALKPEAVTILQ